MKKGNFIAFVVGATFGVVVTNYYKELKDAWIMAVIKAKKQCEKSPAEEETAVGEEPTVK